MRFFKYHGLGNDYLVVDAADAPAGLTPHQIQRLCDRHLGVGSDGLLWGPLESSAADFRLRLFNPDASEFEISGNGLRIFCRYLWDRGLVGRAPFTVETLSGQVTCQVDADGRAVTVDMGRVSFDSRDIPVTGPSREVLDEMLEIEGERFHYSAATVGNPHCVVLCEEVSAAYARRWGPFIETDPRFPQRTNVQFMRVLDRQSIQIEIWERSVGYTLASGSSSCAAASVAHRLGLCDQQITVRCAGGPIQISIGDGWMVQMRGSVIRVCEGMASDEVFESG
jgi:diaminopimelate epimerase